MWSGFTDERMNSKSTRMEKVDTSKKALLADFALRVISENGVRGGRQGFGMEPSVIAPDPMSKRVTASGEVLGPGTAVEEKRLRTV